MKLFKILLLVALFWHGANSVVAQTWMQTSASTNLNWLTIASSADGSKLVASAADIYGYETIWVSTNSGAAWAVTSPPNTNTNIPFRASLSADGTKMVASDGAGLIYTSTDLGATWTSNSVPVGLVAITLSADGSKMVASAAGEFIYT